MKTEKYKNNALKLFKLFKNFHFLVTNNNQTVLVQQT